jgi:tRNA(fMet)-specific endonuclease VapC
VHYPYGYGFGLPGKLHPTSNADYFQYPNDFSPSEKIVNPSNEVEYISVVTIGEARSIAFQNGWGNAKTDKLENALSKAIILDIKNEIIIDRYVQIDAYSQKKHPAIPYSFKTPRNMGKNDLWIAATASFLEVPLLTTDNDFDHLHEVFINLITLHPKLFK